MLKDPYEGMNNQLHCLLGQQRSDGKIFYEFFEKANICDMESAYKHSDQVKGMFLVYVTKYDDCQKNENTGISELSMSYRINQRQNAYPLFYISYKLIVK